jgi:hypothetical protein
LLLLALVVLAVQAKQGMYSVLYNSFILFFYWRNFFDTFFVCLMICEA